MKDLANRRMIKILITLVTIVYGVLPAIADLNETHIYNPEWSPHARVHGVWFLFFGASMSFMSLYFLWLKDNLFLPIFVGLMFASGFWVAYVTSELYAGALVDENGVETRVLGLESNVFVFSVVTIVLLGALAFAFKNDGLPSDPV
ncbi:MAG: DUF6640 family protein [Pseudomonadota bacterium]